MLIGSSSFTTCHRGHPKTIGANLSLVNTQILYTKLTTYLVLRVGMGVSSFGSWVLGFGFWVLTLVDTQSKYVLHTKLTTYLVFRVGMDLTYRPRIWCSNVFFIISYKILFKNHFNSFFKFAKIKIKNFESPKSIRNYEKKQRLEHQTLGWWFVCPIDPASQCIILKIIGFLKQLLKSKALALAGLWVILHYYRFTVIVFGRIIWKIKHYTHRNLSRDSHCTILLHVRTCSLRLSLSYHPINQETKSTLIFLPISLFLISVIIS